VVNWHRWELTAAALRSLAAARELLAPAHTLVLYVVDNESAAPPPPDLPPDVTVLAEAENLGYGGGNNRGAAEALRAHPDLDALFILNNDATIDGSSLRALVTALAEDPGLAVAAPVLTLPDGTVESAGGRCGWRRRWYTTVAPDAPVDFVSGAAFLIRRAAWDDVGGFDLCYFHYVEDVDLGWTLRQCGWRLRVVGDARVVHQKSRSPAPSGVLAYYTVRNQFLFWRKTHDLRAVGVNTALRVLRFLVPVRHLVRGDTIGWRWAWRGLWDGLRGRCGRVADEHQGGRA
jgi:GT2 family glycosyltransferase